MYNFFANIKVYTARDDKKSISRKRSAKGSMKCFAREKVSQLV